MENSGEINTLQKMVTFYLDSERSKDSQVREHLQDYLSEGWIIKSISGFGGHSEKFHVRGWFAVVIEK